MTIRICLKKITTALLLVLLIQPMAKAQDKPLAKADTSSAAGTDFRKVENNAFNVGESLKYDLKYGFVKGAETQISVTGEKSVRGRNCYHIEFTANTVNPFDSFFHVDDKYETFIDKDGLFPMYFKQRVREGKYTRDDEVEFHHEKGIAKSLIYGKDYDIAKYSQDIVSAYFFIRSLDLRSKVGQTISMNNFSNDKDYPLDIKILRRDVIETDLGTFRCIVVEPLVRGAGLFKSEGRILIWMTDDENKIPVKISIKVVVGSINAELREMSGVKNPLTSQIKD
jgi:hypothetical protein